MNQPESAVIWATVENSIHPEYGVAMIPFPIPRESYGSYIEKLQVMEIGDPQKQDKVNRKQLEQYLSVITKFRNVCTHGERLFSYQTRNDIPDTELHRKLEIPRNGTQYAMGKRDLFAVVIAFRYLLPNEDFKQFKAGLSRAIRNYLKSSGAMTESKLYRYMGFPNNWSKTTAYQK